MTAVHDRAGRRSRSCPGRSQAGRADVRRRAEEDDHLLHLSRTPTGGGAAPITRGRRLLPALQRQRRRREPRLAGHRLLVPALQRRCPSPRAARLSPFFGERQAVDGRAVRRRRRPARPAVRRRAVVHAAAARPARLRQGPAHPRDGEDDPPRVREGAAVVADHRSPTTRRRAAVRRARRPARSATTCAQIYGQTWGTVYDTINYTTTGALGDWFDSSIGPGRGRHRQRDVVLAPRQEHRLRPAHRAAARRRQQGADLRAPGRDARARDGRRSRRPGRKGYVPNQRLARKHEDRPGRAAAEHVAQDDITRPAGTVGTGRQHRVPVRGAAHEGDAATSPGSTTAACASTCTVQNVQGIGERRWRR